MFREEVMERFFEKRNCKYCNEEFWANKNKTYRKRCLAGIRGRKMVTCSPKCSKLWQDECHNNYRKVVGRTF